MANAIILHRRRGEIIEPGSQTFTGNGMFVAPYSAVYTISMIGSKQKAGNGGTGADGYYRRPSGSIYADAWAGGGGGGGGGQLITPPQISGTMQLNKGDTIPITVNTSMVSFGSNASCAGGTPAANGQSPVSSNASPGGSGGAGEHLPIISMPPGWATSQSAVAGRTGASGRNGGSAGSSMYGGSGGNGGDLGGGRGGDGGDMRNQTGYSGSPGTTGSPAVTGSITVSWGGNG